MKTKEELNQIKEECETLSTKLQDLSDDELQAVTGGSTSQIAAVLLQMAISLNAETLPTELK